MRIKKIYKNTVTIQFACRIAMVQMLKIDSKSPLSLDMDSQQWCNETSTGSKVAVKLINHTHTQINCINGSFVPIISSEHSSTYLVPSPCTNNDCCDSSQSITNSPLILAAAAAACPSVTKRKRKRAISSKQSDVSNKKCITYGRWLDCEHAIFIKYMKIYGHEWKEVAKHLPTRSATQIRSHAQKYLLKLEGESVDDKTELSKMNNRKVDKQKQTSDDPKDKDQHSVALALLRLGQTQLVVSQSQTAFLEQETMNHFQETYTARPVSPTSSVESHKKQNSRVLVLKDTIIWKEELITIHDEDTIRQNRQKDLIYNDDFDLILDRLHQKLFQLQKSSSFLVSG